MKILIAVIVTAAVTVSGVLWVSGGIRGLIFGAVNTPMPLRIEKTQRGELIRFVTAPGKIEPKTKVSISARVSARITDLPFEEGADVTKGSEDGSKPDCVLVKLDAKDLEASLLSARARRNAQAAQTGVEKIRIIGQQSDLKSLRVDLEKKELDLKRQKQLLASGDVSQSAVDDLNAAVESLRAKLESSQHGIESSEQNLKVLQHNIEAADAEIAKAQENLAYTTIVSPINGTVTKLNSKVGELAIVGITNSPGTVIMEVADLSKMLLRAEVNESDIGGVRLGQHARIRIQAYPDRVFDGSVSAIALTATEQPSKHFEVEILIDTKGDRIFSGLTGDVDIEISKFENVIKIPSQAVVGRSLDELPVGLRENENVDKTKTIAAVVYKVVEGKAMAWPVKIGASDATHTIVEKGLTESDLIVTGPYKMLENIPHEQKVVDERDLTEEQRRTYYLTHQKVEPPRQENRGPGERGSGSRR